MRAILFCALLTVSGFAQSSQPPSPAPKAPPEPNLQARYLAGMPVRDQAMQAATLLPGWAEHAAELDQAWAKLEKRQLSPIREWIPKFVPEAAQDKSPLYYFFSGPDFLYAQAFFPNAATYILCGIEPLGTLPDVTRIPKDALEPSLRVLRQALDPTLNFGFFITKKMKVDLEQTRLQGTLPILMVFLARGGYEIDKVDLVGFDRSGTLVEGKSQGVRITFHRPTPPESSASPTQTLYYFCTDISDDAVNRSGFLKWCAAQGDGNSFLKAASYLMHTGGFDSVRQFILTHSKTIIQDDAGIPIKFIAPDQWTTRLFGAYPGPIETFKQHHQPALAALYRQSNPPPLSFGFGYRWHSTESSLLMFSKKQPTQ